MLSNIKKIVAEKPDLSNALTEAEGSLDGVTLTVATPEIWPGKDLKLFGAGNVLAARVLTDGGETLYCVPDPLDLSGVAGLGPEMSKAAFGGATRTDPSSSLGTGIEPAEPPLAISGDLVKLLEMTEGPSLSDAKCLQLSAKAEIQRWYRDCIFECC